MQHVYTAQLIVIRTRRHPFLPPIHIGYPEIDLSLPRSAPIHFTLIISYYFIQTFTQFSRSTVVIIKLPLRVPSVYRNQIQQVSTYELSSAMQHYKHYFLLHILLRLYNAYLTGKIKRG